MEMKILIQVTFTTRPGDGHFEGTVTADVEKKSTHNHKFLVSLNAGSNK